MKKYDSYKPIALPWLFEIPSHWDILRNKNIFTEQKAEVGENSSDFTLLSLTLNGIIPRDLENAKGKFPESFDKYKIVKKGNMAFCLFDIDETPRTVGISAHDGMLTGAYTIMSVNNINSQYIYYYYLSLDNAKAMKPLYSGLRKTIKTDVFQGTKIPVPPREEQDQIVRFLDWKVSEINRLIAVKKREIGLFDELKRNTISRVLNCDIYPKIRFKYCAWIRARLGWRGLKAHEYVDSGFPFLSAFNIVNDEMNWENLNYINQDRYDESPEIKLSVGDILLVKDGAGIGKCAKIDNLPYGESTPNGSLAVITPNSNIYYKFLYYFLISADFKNISNRILTGMGVPHLTQHFLKNVEIPCPDYDVQQSIAETLEKKCIAFNDSISKINAEIEKLEELKKRLISDVVTGQIDVRNIEIPEFEYVEESAKSPEEMETDTDEEV